ncbi:MAG: hypothetical protein IPK77_11815 [Cellvibrio sp.]|nr:hypothetical protein [Cellvibrio sp.]MBK8187861.1 hypothetical protein [Cellvibrio sp.]
MLLTKLAIRYFCLAVAYLGIAFVLYWESKYWLSFNAGSGEGEFREGASIVMLFTSPAWLYLLIATLIKVKTLPKKVAIINLFPTLIMAFIFLIWLI